MLVVGAAVLVIVESGLLLAFKAGFLGVDKDLLRYEHEEQMYVLCGTSIKAGGNNRESAPSNVLETF